MSASLRMEGAIPLPAALTLLDPTSALVHRVCPGQGLIAWMWTSVWRIQPCITTAVILLCATTQWAPMSATAWRATRVMALPVQMWMSVCNLHAVATT